MNDTKTYPYTYDQLRHFKKELEEAGGVEELMLKKEAIVRTNGITMIATYKDKESYRQKYLIGVYESLRTNYHTEVPYVFWSKIYELSQRI